MQVRQDKSNPASTTETPVNIGLGPLTLVDLKLSTKQQMKRLKRKRKGAAAAEEDSADEEPAGEEPGAAQMHHLWIACTPCVSKTAGWKQSLEPAPIRHIVAVRGTQTLLVGVCRSQ